MRDICINSNGMSEMNILLDEINGVDPKKENTC